MDSADDVTNNDEIEKKVRTLWVGNLHPKVSSRDIAELFYQVGPVEYVEFAYDENEICENFALVVFKYSCSVEDSLKFFKGTKLYGLPIITKNYSNHFEDPVFNEQLNYFKQLIKVEQNCQPNSPTECKWIDKSLDEKNIPESLPEPPMHEDRSHNKNHNNYDRRCSSKVNSSKYRHNARNSKRQNSVNSGEYYPIHKSHHSQKHYKNSEHNSSSGSMEMFNYEQDSYYNNPSNDRKHHDHTSFNRKESAYHNQESMSTHEKNSGKDNMLVRDLRDTMFRKRNRLDSNFHIDMNTNAGCTSILDLRDTMYQNKNSRYEDFGQQNYKSDSNNRWSERNQNTHGSSSYLKKEPRKNNYNSERYNESNTKYQNNYADRSYNQNKSNNGIQEYGSEFPNNYNDGYRRDKNWRNNNKYNNPQNIESSSRQHNSYHPYKRNNEHSGHNRDKSYNRGGSDRSRHNYYS